MRLACKRDLNEARDRLQRSPETRGYFCADSLIIFLHVNEQSTPELVS